MAPLHHLQHLSLLASLSAKALAFPSPNPISLVSRDDEDRFGPSAGKDVWCPDVNWDNAEERLAVWYGSYAGETLDDWINEIDDDTSINIDEPQIGKGAEWFRHMVRDVRGAEDDMFCTDIGHVSCEIKECNEWFDKGYGTEYWILQQVAMFNAVLEHLRDYLLLENTIKNTLQIPKLVEEFSEPEKGVKVARVQAAVGAALGAMTAPLGLAGSAGGTASAAGGMVGGIFGAIGAFNEEDEDDTVDKMAEIVRTTFESTSKSLTDVLANALGTGDQKKLPESAKSGLFITDTARFFSEGKWMIKTDGEELKTFIERSTTWMTQSLITVILRQRDFGVYIWDDLSQEDCVSFEKDAPFQMHSARWIQEADETGCFFISDKLQGHVLQEAWGPMKSSDNIPRDLDEEQLKLLTDEYEVSLPAMYKNAVECASTDEETSTSEDLFGLDSDKMPRCLFNLPVKRVEFHQEFHGASYFETSKEDFKS